METEGREHPPDLAVNSLYEHHSQTGRRKPLDAFDAGACAVEDNAAQESLRQVRSSGLIEYDLVFFFDLEARMRQSLHEIPVVCEEKEAFALGVEPADIREGGEFRRKQIINGVGRVWIAPGTDKPGGFVENDVNWRALMDEFAIDLNVIAGSGLKVEIPTRFPIYRHPTGCD